MNIQIRQAADSDIDALIALTRRTISNSYRPFLGDDAVDAFIGSGAADQYVRDTIGRCSVILNDESIVGYSVCRDNLIDLMMIDSARHGEGLGSVLLEHVEESLSRRHNELTLESFWGNDKANRFYRKHGWIEVRKFVDRESGVSKIMFRKAASARDRSS